MNDSENKALDALRAKVELLEIIVDAVHIQVKFHKKSVESFDDLSLSAQREIALAWLKYMVTKYDHQEFFVGLLNLKTSLLLIDSLITKPEEDVADVIADKVINNHKNQINDFVVQTLNSAQ